MTTVLKLGGSVITDKGEPETIDRPALASAAAALGHADPDRLVVVHGGGSFGHYHADAHGVSSTAGTHDAAAVTAIHDAMGRLNTAVVAALQEEELSAVPVRPLSAAVKPDADSTTGSERGRSLGLATRPVRALLAEGFVPVLHGDVVATPGAGCTVASGDALVAALAGRLAADRVGLCTTVPGVLDADGAIIEEIDGRETVADVLGDATGTDVTGGMAAKVETLLGIDPPASIFGPDALSQFLATGTAGTVVR